MVPTDKNSMVYWQFFFLGLSTLLPWNFFITADGYWSSKFDPPCGNNTNDNTSTVCTGNSTNEYNEVLSQFRNFFAIFNMGPQILFGFYISIKQKNVNEKARVFVGLMVMTLIFVVTAAFVKIDTDQFQVEFFAITIATIFICNAAAAFVTATILGKAARFLPRYSQAVMSGQGMGGLFSAVAFIIAKSVTDVPSDYALIFFIVAVVFLLLAIVCYTFLESNEYYKHYNTQQKNGEVCSPGNGENNNIGDILLEKSEPSEDPPQQQENPDANSPDASIPDVSGNASIKDPNNVKGTYMEILAKIFPHFFCCFFTFFVTLSVFPAVTAAVRPQVDEGKWSVYFTAVSCFLLFNLSDFIGRSLPSRLSIPSQNNKFALVAICLSRAVFLFLFTFCNVKPRNFTSPLFVNDAYFISFMLLFGLSNGYVSTLAIKYSPQMVQCQAERQQVGKIMSFSIACGLAAGAAFSFVVSSWI